jgi:hypothetical protein
MPPFRRGRFHSQTIARPWLHGRAGRNVLSSRYSETRFPFADPPSSKAHIFTKNPMGIILCNHCTKPPQKSETMLAGNIMAWQQFPGRKSKNVILCDSRTILFFKFGKMSL